MKKEYEGLQIKEENHEGWIKYDRFGYEGLSEVLSYRFSRLLSTRLSFCEYAPFRNDKGTGCFSKSVVVGNEKLTSLYAFFPEEPKNLSANHLFEYYVPNIVKTTGLKDFGEWLTELFVFDMLIENEDRNPGNILLITKNGKYRYAPVMDNANSLGYRDDNLQFKGAKLAKPLMMSHSDQVRLFQDRYDSKMKLIGSRMTISDLYDYYSKEYIIHACEILRHSVAEYFSVELEYC